MPIVPLEMLRRLMGVPMQHAWISKDPVKIVNEVIEEYPREFKQLVEDDSEKNIGWFVGRAMQRAHGSIDPSRVRARIREILIETREKAANK